MLVNAVESCFHSKIYSGELRAVAAGIVGARGVCGLVY